jgi:Resolvase, N terminal domain/Recombinase
MEPEIAKQLERVAAGKSDALEAARLRDAADSLRELVALLEWLDAAGADLIAHDVRLDTRESSGQEMVALLREVARWERNPERPRGRPGLAAHDPELAAKIAALRERGLSLHAIAAALNAERIPTPRGGAEWRPSSVQAALGYRRPPPPAPGAPKPPKQRKGPRHDRPHPPHPKHPKH